MMTYNLTCDLAKPCTQKLEIPANTPYVLRLELFWNGQPHTAWDGNYGYGNVIPTASNYQANLSSDGTNTYWTNTDSFLTNWFANSTQDVEAYGNVVEVKCAPHVKGTYGVKLMLNSTGTNWETIPDGAIESGDADPRGMCRTDLLVDFTSKESCNPTSAGGIQMTGSYVDGEEFSFTLGGVENQIS